MLQPDPATRALVLASASQARARMLEAAGLAFTAVDAGIDEEAIREALAVDHTPAEDVAALLAETKAQRVAENHPRALVIGADQVLVFDGEILDKPPTREAARDQLLRLRGKRHTLASACAVVEGDRTVWRGLGTAELTMRVFSPEFLGRYLAAMGSRVTSTVGAYEVEGLGVQLFEKIEGDMFTIQGLPLIDLLAFLRGEGAIPS